MPGVPLNYVAILVAAVLGMVIGALWYGPVFGKQWMALSKYTAEDMAKAKAQGMAGAYVLSFIGLFVMSFITAHVVFYANAATAFTGALFGFWMWLGYVATTLLNTVLWDKKPWGLYVLNAGHYLVVLLVMGALLALW